MWMESDRLTDSVFREFYAERDVVHEERRLREVGADDAVIHSVSSDAFRPTVNRNQLSTLAMTDYVRW